ncbi:MAG: helicase-related protein [Sulfuricaulis sp.]
MTVKCLDPRKIHDAYKEAVVDSLLNNLSARVSGRGEFYSVIFGNKPSKVLLSEFLLPMPEQERSGDEEADPIQISAHGLDFQIRSDTRDEKLQVQLTGAVYVRILPTADDIRPGGRLELSFPLTHAAERALKDEVNASLRKLKETLPGGDRHPDWRGRSLEARRAAYATLGLPFEPARDRTGEDEEDVGVEDEDGASEEGENASRIRVSARGNPIPDALASDSALPAKWHRIDLDLPPFLFSASTAASDASLATDTLNAAISARLRAWTEAVDGVFPGKLWGFRRGLRVRPSHQQDWEHYLASIRASGEPVVVPSLALRWVANVVADPLDSTRTTVHVALENWTPPLNRNNAREIEPALFHVSLSVLLPAAAHLPLHLDRVNPSYRYNQYLKYPALGFNGAVVQTTEGEHHRLTTTWSPRYVLPRIVPTIGDVVLNIARLAQADCLTGLTPLVTSYERWLESVAQFPVDRGLEGPQVEELKARERDKLQQDLGKWRSELAAIRCGIDILTASKQHWAGPGPQRDPRGIPFEAWLSMNATMAKLATTKGYTDWRLFQLAFIVSSIPAFVTRLPAFHSYYSAEVEQYANSVTLLYFATGGGKSEAFLGLLAFVVFLDRLRGKHCGVSALMRYPLRLLTLQQARRTFATLGAAEQVRFARKHPGEPFSLGFWVGGSNTPNWHSEEGYSDIPTERSVPPNEEATYLSDPSSKKYRAARDRWLKLPVCPFCQSGDGHPLALRRWSGRGGNTLGHFCSSPKSNCEWNARFDEPTPLPFYVVDEDIYDLAPTVLLGTIDKLAALGQSQGTIRKFFGMFGFAPLLESDSCRLFVPAKSADWEGHPGSKAKALFPSYADGDKRYFDPFPSLLIQDEAHLLDESLGTFAGLFESALEAAFDELTPVLGDQVVGEPGRGGRRKIKVIAASATVSEPQRQMRNLYQRLDTVQFPHPGPDLYQSFYATPKQPDASGEDQERRLVAKDNVEIRAHWARVYGAILTNGHRHTVAMASVLGHFHLLITGLYERLRSGDSAVSAIARQELVRWASPGPTQVQFQRLLKSADDALLLTLVDLHRISLTYVTNKKGGDQVIDTEKSQSERLHHDAGFLDHQLSSELLSGAVSAADIQDIVRRAEKRVAPGEDFPELNATLRSVIATSAISHGVDVEEFNAMFFAGMPSDIAEYIQASSRVGRSHVGFSLLVPIPQRYRDRFVTEIHDIFHRFLERMILPASIDRWAEKALVRVMPSFFQEFVCGVQVINAICAADAEKKPRVRTQGWATEAQAYLAHPENVKSVQRFMENALGFGFDPPPEGLAYYKAALKQQINLYQQDLEKADLVTGTKLTRFFEMRDRLNRPMTSLRDVDLPGVIYESGKDAGSAKVAEGATARVMQFIRRGTGADIDSTDERTESRGAG